MDPTLERTLRVELRAATNSFLNTWRIESEAGVGQVDAPASDTTSAYAWIGLAGNVLWASTSLLAPEATVAIRTLSFVGAGVPAIAGLVQVYQQPDPTPQNLALLRRAVSL